MERESEREKKKMCSGEREREIDGKSEKEIIFEREIEREREICYDQVYPPKWCKI